MNKQHQTLCSKVLLGILLIALAVLPSEARWLSNDGEKVYGGGGGRVAAGTSLRDRIIQGAADFLESKAQFMLFLKKIELSDLNGVEFDDLRNTLYEAVENMRGAAYSYTAFTQKAAATPYDKSAIHRLQTFDYNTFQKERGLNTDIFSKVETFLADGRVTEMFAQMAADTSAMLEQLERLQKSVADDTLPANITLWRLNQAYSEFHLAGQYAAEVFYKISEKVDVRKF